MRYHIRVCIWQAPLCENIQMDAELNDTDVGFDKLCRLYTLFERGNVQAESILHRGKLFKIRFNDQFRPISIPQYWIYANRGQVLSDLSFLEYICMIDVVRRSETTDMQETHRENLQTDRRWAFVFDPEFVLYNDYIQRFKSMYKIPELAGRGSPRHPGHRPVTVKKRKV